MRATLPVLALPQWLREGSDRATILRWRNLRRIVGIQWLDRSITGGSGGDSETLKHINIIQGMRIRSNLDLLQVLSKS